MFWLVDGDFAAAGQGERGKTAPSLFSHFRDWNILVGEIAQGGGDVVTHKE
jgi:hypothetical protein